MRKREAKSKEHADTHGRKRSGGGREAAGGRGEKQAKRTTLQAHGQMRPQTRQRLNAEGGGADDMQNEKEGDEERGGDGKSKTETTEKKKKKRGSVSTTAWEHSRATRTRKHNSGEAPRICAGRE